MLDAARTKEWCSYGGYGDQFETRVVAFLIGTESKAQNEKERIRCSSVGVC